MTGPGRSLMLDLPDDFILPKSTLMQKFSVQIIGKRPVTFGPTDCKTNSLTSKVTDPFGHLFRKTLF